MTDTGAEAAATPQTENETALVVSAATVAQEGTDEAGQAIISLSLSLTIFCASPLPSAQLTPHIKLWASPLTPLSL